MANFSIRWANKRPMRFPAPNNPSISVPEQAWREATFDYPLVSDTGQSRMHALLVWREVYHSKLAIFGGSRGCCCIMWGIDEKAMPTDNP